MTTTIAVDIAQQHSHRRGFRASVASDDSDAAKYRPRHVLQAGGEQSDSPPFPAPLIVDPPRRSESSAAHESPDGGHQLDGALLLMLGLSIEDTGAGVSVQQPERDLVQCGLDR